MRVYSFAAALAAMSFAAPLEMPHNGDLPLELLPNRRRGKGQNNRRGKGLKAKAKRRPNMLRISKRVRRKHRRAA